MPHYHLHLHNAHVDASDEQGHELENLTAAREMALHGIRDFLAHEVMQGRLDLRGQVDVANDSGHILASVTFVEAVAVISPQA
jgi:hypothetical protein